MMIEGEFGKTDFNLELPVNLLERNGDPRKRAYVLNLLNETREYWHKFAGKRSGSYSPSIFRLHEAEGLLKKQAEGKRSPVPEHIITVMSGCKALGEILGFEEKDLNDLLLAAAVHDINKDIEVKAVKMVENKEESGYGQEGYDLADEISVQKLKFAGVPENIIHIHDKTGHASCPEIKKVLDGEIDFGEKENLKIIILHYLDDIVTYPNIIDPEITAGEEGERLNALDRRCIQNENNPVYEKYNIAWKKDPRNTTGETAFQMQRRVGHLVEQRLAELLNIKDPLTLPSVIYSRMQKDIQNNWDKLRNKKNEL